MSSDRDTLVAVDRTQEWMTPPRSSERRERGIYEEWRE